MNVFRIETAQGHGICHAHGLCGDYHARVGGKCPANSFGVHNVDAVFACAGMNQYRYAFPSLAAARAWFPADDGRQVMKEHGGQIVEYAVSGKVIPDTKGAQCLFDYAAATRIATHDLVTLV